MFEKQIYKKIMLRAPLKTGIYQEKRKRWKRKLYNKQDISQGLIAYMKNRPK